ncbi:hypothetical protein JKF63_04450 [Porcisia hertigi]|uniref:Autophagy-related protein n=1 Tax=Porcisia hertigi TaxID=2761500 RepID=A0A836IVY6_9TRYP|nr:hypothetical protein JKF63_04450 [Porcisia hertigi]
MSRVGDGRAPLGGTHGPPYSPSSLSPSSVSSLSSAPYLSPCECDDMVDGSDRLASKSRAPSSTIPQAGAQTRQGKALRSTGKGPHSLPPTPSVPSSASTITSAGHSPLQGVMRDQTGARGRNQRTVSVPGPSPDNHATLAKGKHSQTRASVAVSCERGFDSLQSPSQVYSPPRLAQSLSSPLTASLEATTAPTSPPPLPRTHYQYMHSFDYRCRLSNKMRALYGTGTVPVIVEPAESHFRVSPPSSSLVHGEAKSSSDPVGGGCAKGGRPSFSGRTGASVVVPSLPSVSTTPSTKSTLKCILPRSKSVAEVILTLRDRLALDSCQSVFLSVGENDVLVPGNSLLGDLYERYRNMDGFLYLGYLLENTFGGDGRSTTPSPSPSPGEAAAIFLGEQDRRGVMVYGSRRECPRPTHVLQ